MKTLAETSGKPKGQTVNMKICAYNVREDEEEFFSRFSKQYAVDICCHKESPGPDTVALAKGCPCISIVTRPVSAGLIQSFHDTGVGLISTRTVGFDHIDLDAARKLGIQVENISYSTSSVSEYTVMLMLLALRKIKLIAQRIRVQNHTLPGLRGKELRSCTVGIIGTGRIGQVVIRNLTGFGCRIIAHGRRHGKDIEPFCDFVSIEELYRQSDVISLHIPASEENYHLINNQAIQKMKPGVIIVNTSRGQLINTDALIQNLESGRIGGAALDVLENEKRYTYRDLKNKEIKHRGYAVLKSMPNVILTPHTAFYTDQAISDMVENSIRSCVAFMKK